MRDPDDYGDPDYGDPDDDDATDYERAPGLDPADAGEGDQAMLRTIDARGDLPPHAGPPMTIPQTLPRAASAEAAREALRVLLRAFYDEGKRSFQTHELLPRYPYRDRTTVAKYLTALCEGDMVNPPGLTVERAEGDTYRLVAVGRTAMAGNTHRP